MADVPHFDIPFRFDTTGHAVTVEQDSLEEISNCVEAVMRTIIGQRIEAPDFGIPDPTFSTQPLALQQIIDAVLVQEPRAALLLEQHPSQFDQLIDIITARVSIESQGVNSA